MLRERYPVDKLFDEMAVQFPKMDLNLAKIDGYPDDEQLYQLIKADLSKRRILQDEKVPDQEKVLGIFELHTDIICRGKESHPVEYGHKVWLNEVDGGIVTHFRILDGNPNDETQWEASLNAHVDSFGQPP